MGGRRASRGETIKRASFGRQGVLRRGPADTAEGQEAGKAVQDSWTDLYNQLLQFQRRHGHCLVPTLYRENPKLGRWVAVQRYRRRINALNAEQIQKLDRIGFVWSPSDLMWERMFQALRQFIRDHGHANVPENYPPNVQLARWVQTQRHRRWKGWLSPERIRRLDTVGFLWAVYKREGLTRPLSKRKKKGKQDESPGVPTVEETERMFDQKLYVLGNGSYVQYSGRGKIPGALEAYLRARGGTYPPFIPLPSGPTCFYIGERYVNERRYVWDGQGSLPEVVKKYVSVNGTLPRYETLTVPRCPPSEASAPPRRRRRRAR